jgi:hypothetical protein
VAGLLQRQQGYYKFFRCQNSLAFGSALISLWLSENNKQQKQNQTNPHERTGIHAGSSANLMDYISNNKDRHQPNQGHAANGS